MTDVATDISAEYWTDGTLPFPLFIECSVTKSLQPLVKSGEPDPEALKVAWMHINNEYSEIVNPSGTRTYAENNMRLLELSARITRLGMIAAALRIGYHKTIHEALEEDVPGLELNVEDEAAYMADIDRLMIEVKCDEIELSQLMEADEESATGDVEKPTIAYQYFDELLAEVSYCEGREVLAENLTTRRAAVLIARMKTQHKRKAASQK